MALGTYEITITKMCNYALTAAGARNLITDIDVVEDTEEWRLCDLFFWQAIMEAMQAGEWGFATDRVEITKDATDPEIGTYEVRYAVPTDSLLILFQIDEKNDRKHYDYKREGDWILSNEENSDGNGYFRYIKRVETVSKYSPLFTKAGYVNLAMQIRNSLKGEDEWHLRLQQQYKDILSEALGQSEMEDFVKEGNNDVVESGLGGCHDTHHHHHGHHFPC